MDLLWLGSVWWAEKRCHPILLGYNGYKSGNLSKRFQNVGKHFNTDQSGSLRTSQARRGVGASLYR
jgi:hypothetical protein